VHIYLVPICNLLDNEQVPEVLASISNLPVMSLMGRSEGVEFFQHVATWLALVEGRKHWMLARPEAEKPEENPTCAMNSGGEVSGVYNARSNQVLHCIQEPGEIIYFPDMWWHSTCNLAETTIGIGGQRYIPGWQSPPTEVIRSLFRKDINRLIAAVRCF
jgi:hypothetical protein